MRRDSSFCAKSVRYNIFTNGAPYTLFLQKTQPRKLSSTHINTNSTYNNLTLAQGFLTWGAPKGVLKSIP